MLNTNLSVLKTGMAMPTADIGILMFISFFYFYSNNFCFEKYSATVDRLLLKCVPQVGTSHRKVTSKRNMCAEAECSAPIKNEDTSHNYI